MWGLLHKSHPDSGTCLSHRDIKSVHVHRGGGLVFYVILSMSAYTEVNYLLAHSMPGNVLLVQPSISCNFFLLAGADRDPGIFSQGGVNPYVELVQCVCVCVCVCVC